MDATPFQSFSFSKYKIAWSGNTNEDDDQTFTSRWLSLAHVSHKLQVGNIWLTRRQHQVFFLRANLFKTPSDLTEIFFGGRPKGR